MPKEAEKLIAQGFYNDAFDVVLRKIHFTWSGDFWTREVVSTYQNEINSIYLYQGDIDVNLTNFLEIIESEDNLKFYASAWDNNDGEMVLTRNGKVKNQQSTFVDTFETSLELTWLNNFPLDTAWYF